MFSCRRASIEGALPIPIGENFSSLDFSSRYDCGGQRYASCFRSYYYFVSKLVAEIDKQIGQCSDSNRDLSDDSPRLNPIHQGSHPFEIFNADKDFTNF